MSDRGERAPGGPGIPPRWTSSAKQGTGTALSRASRVWFTLSHGIFNEIYYPRVDQACIRDMGMLVTGRAGFFSEEKRNSRHTVALLAPGVPGYRLENECEQGRYRIEKEIVTDPDREVVLQSTRFVPLSGAREDYQLYVLLAPHIGNQGWGNTGWLGDYKGVPVLYAERDGTCLALACSAPWVRRSAGYVGSSDGWQDVARHTRMTWSYERAENGNVALTGEIDIRACGGEFVLALGFGRHAAEAGNRALSSLSEGFSRVKAHYMGEWQEWQGTLVDLGSGEGLGPAPDKGPTETERLFRTSAAVIRTHEDKGFPGGMIASLSIPWGFVKGDDDLGGYHLAWPRDLVETAGGLLAAGAHGVARRVLRYLASTQESDGHWPQNMWLDGTPYWRGVQMDESALPILLVDLARREHALDEEEPGWLWKMVKSAAGYIVQNGPVTAQDRWEEDPGYSPFTLAAEIAALLAAADFARSSGEPGIAAYLTETADSWNDNVERWTYVADTDLAKRCGVKGYYVRISSPETSEAASPAVGFVAIKNKPPGQGEEAASGIVSPDALALVRFGLRAPDDPRIIDTLRVIDALLKVDTPLGPAWHRYNEDGYGEHADGSPFDGTGIGRVWPLITGERAHYELAAGNTSRALQLLRTLEAFAGLPGLIPEQVWDAPDIPGRELSIGRPSGSAMPLVWAHAEYIKLLRSLRDGRVFDAPLQAVARYAKGRARSSFALWRFSQKCRTMPAATTLRIELPEPAVVRWSVDGGRQGSEVRTKPTGLGNHAADLPTRDLGPGAKIAFTLAGMTGRGEEDYCVEVVANQTETGRQARFPPLWSPSSTAG
jgi:glucoamylase